MAALSDGKRAECHAQVMRENTATMGVTKPNLRAAVDAIDQWLSDNASALNAAIPQPARSALTTAQKAHLLTIIIQKRYAEGA